MVLGEGSLVLEHEDGSAIVLFASCLTLTSTQGRHHLEFDRDVIECVRDCSGWFEPVVVVHPSESGENLAHLAANRFGSVERLRRGAGGPSDAGGEHANILHLQVDDIMDRVERVTPRAPFAVEGEIGEAHGLQGVCTRDEIPETLGNGR